MQLNYHLYQANTNVNELEIMLIAAMGVDFAIGQNGQMPWYLPEDLQHFKALTLDQCVIMGRITYESIGKALPKRRNIVISSQVKKYRLEFTHNASIEWVSSLEEALALAKGQINFRQDKIIEHTYNTIAIIGGANLFKSALNFAHRLELTQILATFPNADTFFPNFLELTQDKWQLDQHTLHAWHDIKNAKFFASYHKQPNDYAQQTLAYTPEQIINPSADNNKPTLAYRYLTYIGKQ